MVDDPIIMRPFLDLPEAKEIKGGSHIALFFRNYREQREIAIPFIKKGLLAHEKCLWIHRQSDYHNVLNQLKGVFSEIEIEDYLKTGQLEMLDREAWFPGKNSFDVKAVLQQYRKRHDEAFRRGYEGLRLIMDVPLITEINWELYLKLERAVNESIRDYRVLLICNYDLNRYTTRQIVTITSLHEYTLIKNKDWFLTESAKTVKLQDLSSMENRLRHKENTEPRGIQGKIAEERQRLEDIVLSLGAGLLILDKKMKIVWLNPVAERWFGPLSKLQGTYCYESLKGKEETCPGCSVLMVFQSGKSEITEEYYDPIGRVLRCVATPIKNEKGEVIQVLKLTHDVTREKKTLQALRQAKEKYRTLTENMPETVYTADPKKDFALSYASKSVTGIYGYERTEKQLRKPGFWAEVIYPPDKKHVLSEIHQSYREGRDGTLEYRIVDKSGKVKWIQNRLHWIKDQEGRILYLQGLMQNIDQQKVNESKLKLFTSILDGINDSVFLVNPKTGLIEYVNEAACRLHGYDQKELIGKSPRVFGHPDNPPGAHEKILEATSSGGWEGLLKNSRRDGTAFDICLKTYAISDSSGQPWMYIGIQRDISEEKRMKEQLIHTERMSALGNLASWVAHEYNNLHAIIQGYVDVLFLTGNISPEARESLDTIRSASKKATAITRQLLTFTRRQTVKKAYLKLASAVESTVKMLEKELSTQGIQVEVVHYQPVTILADPVQIGQVIMNMIINARQAMAESPQKIIRLESGKMGNQAFLRISDTGCGIAKEDLKAIFEPFYTTKGHQEGRKPLGTGIGLAISHTIIADHGGQIDVESEASRGSTFTIWLPLETEGITIKPKEITGEINLQDLRVLVVEDEKDIQAIIQKSLEVKGAMVEATDRGKKGFRLIKDNRYEVVLLDLQIPDLQGEELLDMINKLPAEQQPVKVIITGKATIEDVQELKRLQVADILFKPFELEELYATLAAATSGLKQKVGHG